MKNLLISLISCIAVVLIICGCGKNGTGSELISDIKNTGSLGADDTSIESSSIQETLSICTTSSEIEKVNSQTVIDKNSLEYLLKNGTYSDNKCSYRFVDDKETNITGNILLLLKPEISTKNGFTKEVFTACGVKNIKSVKDNGTLGNNKFITLECTDKSMTALNDTIAQLIKLKGIQTIDPDVWVNLEQPMKEKCNDYE